MGKKKGRKYNIIPHTSIFVHMTLKHSTNFNNTRFTKFQQYNFQLPILICQQTCSLNQSLASRKSPLSITSRPTSAIHH